ncbi:MAG TPA: hypothetical protein VH277_13680 [Gemmatimonadaceae bacterium]|jgi:hypothetical protein|nr:hypothetical protein [Gemmatimonadaceae bacterium]
MFNSIVIDVAIGLVLVYLLLSLVCSAVRETLAGVFKTRAKLLEQGIAELLKAAPGAAPDQTSLIQSFFEHPLITVLYGGDYRPAASKRAAWVRPSSLPSYIPKRAFSTALLDLAARGPIADSATMLDPGMPAPALTADAIRAGVARLGSARVQRVVLHALDASRGDLDKARESLEAWYDSAMDRVSGWYKRRTQFTLFGVGLLLTVIADVDTIRITRQLYTDPVRRDVAVAVAGNVSRDTALRTSEPQTRGVAGGNQPSATVGQRALARLDSIGLPIAWQGVTVASFGRPTSAEWGTIWGHVKASVVGWLLTAFAISLGAPFWFDTLSRIMVVRSTIKPHEKSPEEASQDRQTESRDLRIAPAVVFPKGDGASLAGVPTVSVSAPVVSAAGAGAASTAATTASAGVMPETPPTEHVEGDAAEFQPHEWETGEPNGGVL